MGYLVKTPLTTQPPRARNRATNFHGRWGDLGSVAMLFVVPVGRVCAIEVRAAAGDACLARAVVE
jgi:hypothetical protein